MFINIKFEIWSHYFFNYSSVPPNPTQFRNFNCTYICQLDIFLLVTEILQPSFFSLYFSFSYFYCCLQVHWSFPLKCLKLLLSPSSDICILNILFNSKSPIWFWVLLLLVFALIFLFLFLYNVHFSFILLIIFVITDL